MLPSEYDFAWTNKTPCLHTIEGCFQVGRTTKDTEIGEMHALITLDSGEVRHAIIPQAIALPSGMANSYLLAVTPFLIAEHKYTCHLDRPKLQFKGEGTYTMDANKGHHIINMTPIEARTPTPHKKILLHRREPYDPPTFHNHSTLTQNTNRPNTKNPTAFLYHLRFACGEAVLKRTQRQVIGMEVQLGSWDKLKDNLPCDACLAGKMRKTRKAQSSFFTPIKNLALSWTPQTENTMIIPNKNISTDWGIISKTLKPGQNTVFVLYLDRPFGVHAIGTTVCGEFGSDAVFYGVISENNRIYSFCSSKGEEGLYTVEYNDGDVEDMDVEEYNYAYALSLKKEGWPVEEYQAGEK
jgi:hypothetical protein